MLLCYLCVLLLLFKALANWRRFKSFHEKKLEARDTHTDYIGILLNNPMNFPNSSKIQLIK